MSLDLISRAKKLFRTFARTPARAAVPTNRFRPMLEGFEDRVVPAAPVFAATQDRFVSQGPQPFYHQVFATDPDRDWLTYTATNLPTGLSINATTGIVSGTIATNTYQVTTALAVTFSAWDGSSWTDQAATFTVLGAPTVWEVNTTDDTMDADLRNAPPTDANGNISLRSAIMQANANRKSSVLPVYIRFDPTVFADPQTITLTHGKLDSIAADVYILGPGKTKLTIAGGDNKGIFHIPGPASIPAGPTAAATIIADLTMENGHNRKDLDGNASGQGGAVENWGMAFLLSVEIRDGSANLGGAVYNKGSLTVENSVIRDNAGVLLGGALGNGGGVDLFGGHATITGSTIKDNTSETRGAGIALQANSYCFLLDSSLIHNVSANQGGGVYNSGGWFQMSGGVMNENEALAGGGGGLLNEGTALIKNVSFDENKANGASGRGGAVDASTTICVLTNCTFGNNNQALNGPKVATRAGAGALIVSNPVGLDIFTEIYEYIN